MTDTPSSELSEEYLSTLPFEKLIELLLHRTNLVLASAKSELSVSSIEPLKNDLAKIYAAIKARESDRDKTS